MKILITGASGFIGSYMAKRFAEDGHECVATNRETLNLMDNKQVDSFFEKHRNSFSAIIHCAVAGREQLLPYTADLLYENLLSFENLIKHVSRTDAFVSYGSGAEYFLTPKSYYAMSKYVIARRLQQYNNTTNIRLYTCFGEHEKNTRFIKNCVLRCLKNEPVEIWQDRYMDFFYIEDLYTLTKWVIDPLSRKYRVTEIDASYKKKQTLLEIAKTVKSLTNSSSEIKILEKGLHLPYYIGDNEYLRLLEIPLIGFDKGLNNMIEYIKHQVSDFHVYR